MAPQTRALPTEPTTLTDDADREPNDTRANASPLHWPASEPMRYARGSLDGARDTDTFRLDAHPDAVRVTLTPLTPHHDLRLTLLPPDEQAAGARAVIDLGGAGAPEVMPAADARRGLVLQVNAGAASAQREEPMGYQLQLQRLPPGPSPDAWPTEREPNDTPPLANPLATAQEAQAWINHRADADAFALSPTSPQDLTISAPPQGDCPLLVQLLEPPFAERSLLWQGVAAAGAPARFLSLRPASYVAVVRAADGGQACAFSGQPLPYKLALTPSPNPSPDLPELEPNDEPDTPQALTLAAPTAATAAAAVTVRVRGALLSPEDIDRFRVTLPPTPNLPAPARVRVIVTPTDPTLDLSLHAHLVEALLEQSFDTARAGQPEALCDTPTTPSPDAPAQAPTTLDLRIQSSPQGAAFHTPRAYTLDITLHADAHAEREPNDLPAIADASLSTRAPTTGHIYPAGDADTFAFTIPRAAAPSASVKLSLSPPPTLDLSLTLRDDSGAAIARADRGRVGQPESLTADLPPGAYHVTVAAASGASCAAPYTLTLTAPALGSASPQDAPQPDVPTPALDLPLPGLDLEF
jgi:hypothetical protein